ncbi:hypothetical protein [Thiobacillus denitrificans]|uniref:Type I restriction modification DNA specificity domain-containing protein n=1 Tax=Thiobacillus denitrificans TaxID=36861 RepID=A0A119CWR9_THIDE|nr:hypothetical protein [Thiobacillus denitrificans]KVW97081.1 hypothetical protein ABW22_06700 [Thiobacillus denitrificans]
MSRPFDEARYRGLLEGLEVTELPLSIVRKENDKLRIDSGYFSKPMLAADHQIRAYRGGCDELGLLFVRFVKGVFDINAESYTESGVPFLRILNLRSGIIDDANLALIPESVHEVEKKTELLRGEIVLSKTAYPAASVVTLERCNTSQDTIATSLSDYGKSTYTPEALVAYLNSSLGKRLLWRQFQGNVQLHLSLDDGRKVPVPRLGRRIQEAITSAFDGANTFRQQAFAANEQAEQSLLRALGLENWQPPEPLTYTRTSRDAFAAGRLDAEYFAPRVAELLNRLNKDGLTLDGVAPARHERFVPGTRGSFDYIEIGGVRADGTAVSESVPQLEAPSRATWLVKSGDVITSTVRPIRRLSALIAPEQDGHVCSSGFVVLQPASIPAEVLLTYLRLPPVCELLDLHTSASLYPAISELDLLAMPMPRIDAATQTKVVANVRAAQASRRRAAELLEAAKRAVEIAIESDEASALEFLNRETPPQ